MLAQCTASAQVRPSVVIVLFKWLLIESQVEREMGTPAFLILYFAAGIFGYAFDLFVLCST